MPDAPRYRIQYATDPSMADAVYVRVYETRFTLTGLAPATTYYVKLRVITSGGDNLGPYSEALTVTTQPETGFSMLAPLYLKAKATTETSMQLAWGSRGSGLIYRVAFSASPDMANSTFYPTRETSFTVKNLLRPSRVSHAAARGLRDAVQAALDGSMRPGLKDNDGPLVRSFTTAVASVEVPGLALCSLITDGLYKYATRMLPPGWPPS